MGIFGEFVIVSNVMVGSLINWLILILVGVIIYKLIKTKRL